MIQKETLSICQWRLSLTRYCRSVKLGKKKLVVTYNGKPFFEVSKISTLDTNLVKVSLIFTRDKMSEFIDLLEQNNAVILTAYNKQLVKCELIK